MGYGINPPFNGVDPLTGKFYIAGQNVPIKHPQSRSTVSASTGQRRPPVAPVAGPPAPYRGSTAPNMTADRAERYVQNLAQQSDAALAGMVPTTGYSLEDILKMLGLGANNNTDGGGSRRGGGGGGGGVSGVGAMKWPDVQKALQGASTNIAGAYSTAGDQLSKLINEYAAADAARRQAQAQTLQAFGAPQSAADVGGMSAMDVLTALRGQTAAQGAMQQADIEQQLAAYKALLGGK